MHAFIQWRLWDLLLSAPGRDQQDDRRLWYATLTSLRSTNHSESFQAPSANRSVITNASRVRQLALADEKLWNWVWQCSSGSEWYLKPQKGTRRVTQLIRYRLFFFLPRWCEEGLPNADERQCILDYCRGHQGISGPKRRDSVFERIQNWHVQKNLYIFLL